jgi:uncharacterized membrane protein YeaQ/YmgE (transglycosylase-associated protein family)
MDPIDILIWLVIGAVAGWLAGQFIRGGGFGLIGNIVVGIVGSVIAGYLLPLIGIHIGAGFVRAVINAFIGACVLLTIVRLVKR